MATSTYSIKVNRHEGDGWQIWSILLTKEEALKQVRESNKWAKDNGFQWTYILCRPTLPARPVIEDRRKGGSQPTVLANLLNGR